MPPRKRRAKSNPKPLAGKRYPLNMRTTREVREQIDRIALLQLLFTQERTCLDHQRHQISGACIQKFPLVHFPQHQ